MRQITYGRVNIVRKTVSERLLAVMVLRRKGLAWSQSGRKRGLRDSRESRATERGLGSLAETPQAKPWVNGVRTQAAIHTPRVLNAGRCRR